MADVEEVEVVVAHHERATLRVGDVFLKIDTDQMRTDVEVEAMAMAPIPTPEVLWRKSPVLALAALPGTALARHAGTSVPVALCLIGQGDYTAAGVVSREIVTRACHVFRLIPLLEVHPERGRARPMGTHTFVKAAVVLAALSMLAAGSWARLSPASFARFTNWPNHEHFLHDAGVFQIGIGLMMLAALWWRDVIAVVLAGFVFTNTFHAVNHALDLHMGGNASDPWGLLAVSATAAAGLVLRMRHVRRQRSAEMAKVPV
jgi:lysylphosphatidylglycerol synthetase-like protein (DUF2156 family)